MPRVRRTITIQLRYDMPEDEYSKLANAIWSVANLSEYFVVAEHDNKASSQHLNDWYDEDGRSVRWT